MWVIRPYYARNPGKYARNPNDMLRFILNDQEITTEANPAMVLADFVRVKRGLVGTKLACREGDCGACTALVGELRGDEVVYRSVTSCIFPLGNAAGKHVVTIEGLNQKGLNPVQEAIVESGGTQCGFCTPGFVVALSSMFLKHRSFTKEIACGELDGNICRCTGYKSIERATDGLCKRFGACSDANKERIQELIAWGVLPEHFSSIAEKLRALGTPSKATLSTKKRKVVGGGTDLYVQMPEKMVEQDVLLVSGSEALKGITVAGATCTIGAATTLEEVRESKALADYLPRLRDYLKLFGSTPIRQMATVGGNLVNASPIGDSTALFLALNAELILAKHAARREISLKDFYLGYKTLDLRSGELVFALRFTLPDTTSKINFEKVSRRTYLDIASVNSGFHLKVRAEEIISSTISAGGVAPVPTVLKETSKYLVGRTIDRETVRNAANVALSEVTPISDVRGSSEYKKLLLRQLLYSHFITCFPDKITLQHLL